MTATDEIRSVLARVRSGWSTPEPRRCGMCHGRGHIYYQDWQQPQCQRCGGTGEAPAYCEVCRETGRMHVPTCGEVDCVYCSTEGKL